MARDSYTPPTVDDTGYPRDLHICTEIYMHVNIWTLFFDREAFDSNFPHPIQYA